MSNKITIEFCAEDRERLDKLTAALERKMCDGCINSALAWAEQIMRGQENTTPKANEPDEVQKALAETLAKANVSVEAPKNATEEAEASTPATTPQEEEKPTEKEHTKAEPTKTVTHADLKAKVIELSAKDLKLKAQAREIVLSYAPTVGGVPQDKLNECYEKLEALEG